ncbi:MAG: hypothetical protein Q9210_003989 [Variospora velana]
MADPSREIINANPIGPGLNAFRDSVKSTYNDLDLDAWHQVGNAGGLQDIALDLIPALQTLPASRLLRSYSGSKNLFGDLSRLNSAVYSGAFDIEPIFPLLKAVLADESDDVIWSKVYGAVTESTPPPRPLPYIEQTPWVRNTSSFVNSSEHRKYVDDVLKEELGHLYVGVPGFFEAFFGEIEGLEEAGIAVIRKCKEGNDPLYTEEHGWRDWPQSATEKEVLEWFAKRVELFLDFAKEHRSVPKTRRRPLAQPSKPLDGSTAERKLDVGFVNDPKASENSKYHWSQILVPGELKSNPSHDTPSKAWLDLGRYAREVLAAQDTRRFVVGFTLCASVMRLWEFDRVGGTASSSFDINRDGLRFVLSVLGYLWMNEEQLGFDPTFLESDGMRYIEILRNDQQERLVIDQLMKRAPCVAGRATTCWRAHREGDQSRMPLVIKDSWQFPEREEEGELLREAWENGVVNVARYYYHETVRAGGKDDDIRGNVRKGLDVARATNYQPKPSMGSPSMVGTGNTRTTSKGSPKRKRSSSSANALSSLTKGRRNPAMQNRVHRRVIVRDYGKAIYKASSRTAMLAALEGCIEGYESYHNRTKRMQGDVSIGNLMMNEDKDNPSWPSFLIDLDFAINERREQSSGAWSKTGTRAFMAVGVLFNEQHSFMHDLESFFWVLFWICIHYDGPNKGSRIVPQFDKWNYMNTVELAVTKKGIVTDEGDFLRDLEEYFTSYHRPLIPWVNRLRKVVFPGGGRWKVEDRRLYSRMKEILQEASKDPDVLAK